MLAIVFLISYNGTARSQQRTPMVESTAAVAKIIFNVCLGVADTIA